MSTHYREGNSYNKGRQQKQQREATTNTLGISQLNTGEVTLTTRGVTKQQGEATTNTFGISQLNTVLEQCDLETILGYCSLVTTFTPL